MYQIYAQYSTMGSGSGIEGLACLVEKPAMFYTAGRHFNVKYAYSMPRPRNLCICWEKRSNNIVEIFFPFKIKAYGDYNIWTLY